MRELFVIIKASDGEPVWAAVTDPEEAERVAVTAAVNCGHVNLLSGNDLAQHLAGRQSDGAREAMRRLAGPI